MPNYRRYRVPGGCYFFTVNLLERDPNDLLIRQIGRSQRSSVTCSGESLHRTGVVLEPKTWLWGNVGIKHAAEYAALFRPAL